jgi:CRP-like cAMP-binding protein
VTVDEILNNIYPLPAATLEKLRPLISEISYSKGHILLRADRIETDFYFIKRGMVRAFTTLPDNEITFWLGKEGDAVLSMRSYVAHEKGYEDIELIEDSELYVLKTKDLQALYEQDIHIANWGRKFAEQELIRTEQRLISRQCRTALVRYKELLENNPDILQRVQLGHIASYLGITQVTLSRIRREIK